MRLKRLEIIGFKSFRDKTFFNFSEGISAIIGPNGCGKSNIVDAIRWVMGEQRVKSLRGKKMEDVIFNGSDDSAPVGMAEVSLILERNGRQFPGQYSDCSEVMISRRIYREGESEYYINKAPCRLLDIREFFMDTGVGARTYSIVEQESISKLIEAKPEDIREFIEEAAGIKKYRSRRESAARKMESTRQNIARLKDIISEVKTQMNSTSRQAKRAERYKELKKKVKETELTLSLQAFSELNSQIEALQNSRKSLHENSIQVKTNLQALEAIVEDLRLALIENEGTISTLQETFYNAKNEINVSEQKIDFLKAKVADIQSRKDRNLSEIETSRKRKESMEEEIENLSSLIAETDERITGIKNTIVRNQKEVDDLKVIETELLKELEQKRAENFHIVTEYARFKNMQTSLTRGIEDLKKKADRENKDLRENMNKLASVRNALAALLKDLDTESGTIEVLTERENITQSRVVESRNTLEAIEEKIADIKEEMGKKSSRLVSLKEFQEGYEWCNEGTKSILKAKKEGLCSLDGVYGLVADHIRVPKEYESAVEAVLGEKLQYVVVKSHEDGIEAIDYLKKCSAGRGHFVPLKVRNNVSGSHSFEHLSGVERLNSFVTVNDDFKDIIEHLLGDVLLIPNLTAGIGLWRRNGFIGTFVTPEGDVISPNGILVGGSTINGSNSLLRNKREIEELEREIDELSIPLEYEMDTKRTTSMLISELTDELDELRSDIHSAELSFNGKKKDCERLEGEIKWLEQRISVLTYNKDNLDSEEREARQRIQQVEIDLAFCENREKEATELIASLQERCNAVKSELQEKEKELTEKKILLTSLEEKMNSYNTAHERLNAAIADIEREIESGIRDAEVSVTEVAHITSTVNEIQENLSRLYNDHDTIEEELTRKKELHREKEIILREKEAEARVTKVALDNVTRDLNKLEMEIREVSLHIDTLRKGAYDKFQADLASLLPHFTKLENTEVTDLRKHLDQDRKRIEDFGEVNLLALSEYEEFKERYDFLTSQVDDLNASMDTLQKTINRINRLSKKRFSSTFDSINDCFKAVFPRLFPGGKGDLRLTDETNMLETGVDIDIQIPGKKRQSISLLSGGEKSLSAVALIFAILMHKPSPFLILDEVDAALDDTNVTLFKGLIKEISEQSQVIFVTHNKKTMEVADNLFGVTMEKRGITSTVTVSLN